LPGVPLSPPPPLRAVLADDGRALVLSIYREREALAAVMPDTVRAIRLAGELIAAAHRWFTQEGAMSDTCFWCSRAFWPRTSGGRPQRFCSPHCRRAIDAAGRRYIHDTLTSGTLTIADLRNGSATTRALPVRAREGGDDDAAGPVHSTDIVCDWPGAKGAPA
jgi:hypothetical protein